MSRPDNKAAIRHPLYFFPDGDTTIKVEDSVFRIHRYFLIRESKYFRSTLVTTIPCKDPPGSSETNPFVLKDATSEAFADLLWVFYNPEYSVYSATLERWKRILTLAQLWGFFQVQRLCVRELEKMTMPLVDPVEKVQVYQEFNIDENLLHGAYVALTIRPEPLDMEEGSRLGLSTSLKIARARELARASHGATDIFGPAAAAQLQEPEVQTLIRDIFRLQEPVSASISPPLPSQPTPAGKQNPTNDDPVEKEKAAVKSRKNNKS
ncbi:hypothetical protein V8E53_011370 [Lactarius tabidus]